MALRMYRELDAWNVRMELAEVAYPLTRAFPKDERFGPTSQVRCAAVSVPASIAEGYSRTQRGDDLRDLSIARGSLKAKKSPPTRPPEPGIPKGPSDAGARNARLSHRMALRVASSMEFQ